MILPCETKPACVIRQRDGATFIAQAFVEPSLPPLRRQEIGIPNCVLACVKNDSHLICLTSSWRWRSKKLFAYALDDSPQGICHTQENSIPISSDLVDISDIARMVANQSMIVICTPTGQYLRISG